MNGRLVGLAAVVGLALAVGCGGSDSTPAGGGGGGGGGGGTAASGSCNVAASYSCVDYSGTYVGSTTTVCAAMNGTYSSGACTTTGRVGTCTISSGGFTQAIRWYPPITATIGQGACTAPNVWTTG
jgi:hypothetical protein